MLTRSARERAEVARRVVTRAGLAFIFVASAVACIFDQGPDYKGGGRRNSGADVNSTATGTTTATGTDTTSGGLPSDGGAGDTGLGSLLGGE